MAAGEFEADQATQGVAQEMGTGDAGGVENPHHVIGHVGDGIGTRQGPGVASRAALVEGHDLEMFLQRGALRLPEAGEAAKAGGQDHRRGAGPAGDLVAERRHAGWPIWATLAISTRTSGFTSPHWMQ